MKKYVSIISASLLCLTVLSVLVTAESTKNGPIVGIRENFKMEIMDDGQLSEDKMIVTLEILGNTYEPYVAWNHVYIKPIHDEKRVVLKAQHFSTVEGSVKDVIVNKNSFSFTIFWGVGRSAQIVGIKKGGQDNYSIEASALWWSEILNKKIKMGWQSTDKKFVLPYKEIF